MDGFYRKNQIVTIRIRDISDRGEGIGAEDAGTESRRTPLIFVKDTVPGDLAEVSITKVKKTYAFGRLLRIIEPSPDRTEPACPVARACGGCQLQMMTYEAQLRFKESRVRNALERIGGFGDLPIRPILSAGGRLRYRNKTQVPVGKDKEGNLVAGFYAGRTHSIIPATDCLLAPEENRYLLERILRWAKENDIPAYDEETGEGLLRHILIRKGFFTGEVLVCLVSTRQLAKSEIDAKAASLRDLAEQLSYELSLFPSRTCPAPKLAGLVVNVQPERNNVILGNETETVWGKSYIEDTIGEIRYRISAESFYQVNPEQTKKLYDTVNDFACLSGEEIVWDLYCGTGTIGLYLARGAKKVIGVEVVPQAVEDARENARQNGIENADFFCENLGNEGQEKSLLREFLDDHTKAPSLVVVDPPRKGCDEKTIAFLLEAKPARLVYVSCDPSTLARDLRVLADGGYEIEAVQPVDMFPQTVHVETVVLMTNENNE